MDTLWEIYYIILIGFITSFTIRAFQKDASVRTWGILMFMAAIWPFTAFVAMLILADETIGEV